MSNMKRIALRGPPHRERQMEERQARVAKIRLYVVNRVSYRLSQSSRPIGNSIGPTQWSYFQ